jgi:hypothetical protein
MSRYVNVRKHHANARPAQDAGSAELTTDRPGSRQAGESARATSDKRAALFAECYARYLAFRGLAEVERVIALYTSVVNLHLKESGVRERVLDADTVEQYRWQVAPSVAIRAARALSEAIERRRVIKTECREDALRAVEAQLGPAPHDAAVTEAAVEVPPPYVEPAPTFTSPLSPTMRPEVWARLMEGMEAAGMPEPELVGAEPAPVSFAEPAGAA